MRPESAIVNEAFVRRHYPDGQALGRRFKGGDWDSTAPRGRLSSALPRMYHTAKVLWGGADPTVYVPYAQNLWMQSPYVIIKADGDPSRLLPAIRQAVKAVDANLPLRDLGDDERAAAEVNDSSRGSGASSSRSSRALPWRWP